MIKPKILTIGKDYSKEQFMKDAMAGAIVTILAISLSIAFAVSMGVSPEIGLKVSIIASFIIAILGGTYVQVGGPSAVFIVVVVGIMAEHGVEGVVITTFLAGIILFLLGVFKLGTLIKFLPYPITIGFMSGTAVLIFTTQIRQFLGVYLTDVPSNFIDRWATYIRSIGQSDPLTVLVGVLALIILIFWPKVTKKIPGGLVALIVTTLVVHLFNLPIETIGSQFTDLTLALPRLSIPISLNPTTWIHFLPSALTIAFLCAVGSLLTAVASDNLIGKKHCSNTELVAQGVLNMVLGMCGFIPGAGVTTRTVANIESGAKTPIATLIHSILLLVALVFLLPLMRLIPMVTLAAMLMVASYAMSEWRIFKKLLHAPKGDVLVLLTTFFLTIAVELSVAILVGIVLSCLLFMKRMSEEMHVDDTCPLSAEIPKEISVYDVSGPLFFGDTDRFLEAIHIGTAKVLILRLRKVGMMDCSALRALNILHDKCRSSNATLILSETSDEPYGVMKNMGMLQQLGEENVCKEFEDAIQKAKKLVY